MRFNWIKFLNKYDWLIEMVSFPLVLLGYFLEYFVVPLVAAYILLRVLGIIQI